MGVTTRQLTEGDIDFADRLRATVGWNQQRPDWRRFIQHEPAGCFLAEVDGQPAGTATTLTYGEQLGWIGMVIVDPNFRRRGVASALMNAAMSYLSTRVRCIKLDATPDGMKVYESLGFQPEWELYRWSAALVERATNQQAMAAVPWQSPAHDAGIFGADRSAWLASLASAATRATATSSAMGMLRPGAQAAYLGPVTATNPEAGEQLVRDLLHHATGTVYWDVPEPNADAVMLAESLGFARQRPLMRMWAGSENVRGKPELQFAISGPETG